VRYRPDDLDDLGRRFIGLTAYPVSGVETDRYVGGARIVDDDPTPALTLRTGAHRVTAGDPATWTLTLDRPVDYYAYAVARPVKVVVGRQLRVGDLAKRFRLRLLGGGVRPGTPLHRTRLRLFVEIPRGRASATVAIPTRRGLGVTRALSLRLRVPHFDLAPPIRTVRVTPPR